LIKGNLDGQSSSYKLVDSLLTEVSSRQEPVRLPPMARLAFGGWWKRQNNQQRNPHEGKSKNPDTGHILKARFLLHE